jgi:hypothetical protein
MTPSSTFSSHVVRLRGYGMRHAQRCRTATPLTPSPHQQPAVSTDVAPHSPPGTSARRTPACTTTRRSTTSPSPRSRGRAREAISCASSRTRGRTCRPRNNIEKTHMKHEAQVTCLKAKIQANAN